ncbi:MAG: copper oxidase [Stutzerimonas stutzeri]|nr:MAG: copper oxidase [Stutzerimonas stutzeri]
MATITRRSFLNGTLATPVAAGVCPSRLWAQAVESRPLPIPELIDARRQGNALALRTETGRTAFFPGRDSATRGFNGSYLGPTLRIHQGDEVELAVTNAMPDATAVHWHGLLVPAESDGGPHQPVEPGSTWRPRIRVDQPGATLWYHAHPHGDTARQVYEGLAGMLLVADEAKERDLGLPSEYGVDDIPLVLQDKVFEDGRLVYPVHPLFMMQGVRGATVLVNGAPNPVARVPAGLVRLRLLNGANARVFDLSFSDGRVFHWIASDAGLLERPVERRSLWLAPGERAELLVDFSDGRAAALRTGQDPTLARGMMGEMGMMGGRAEPLDAAVSILALEPRPRDRDAPAVRVPDRLVKLERFNPARAVRRRQLRLTMGCCGMEGGGMEHGMAARGGMGPGMMARGMGSRGGGMMGRGMGMRGMFGINGQPFDPERIDLTVRFGDTEIWEVSGGTMPHPFHIHGVHFEVLSRAGSPPTIADQGMKDTVLVQERVELLVRFDWPAVNAPFVYHCHILEHEEGGQMGQYKTV